MFAALALLAAVAGDPATEQRAALEAYRACVLEKAVAFMNGELSGDKPAIVSYAASYACSEERHTLVRATLQFLGTRRPNLGEGGRSKVAAMFLEQQDAELEAQVEAARSRVR